MILQPIACIVSSTVIVNDKIKTHNHSVHVVVYNKNIKVQQRIVKQFLYVLKSIFAKPLYPERLIINK